MTLPFDILADGLYSSERLRLLSARSTPGGVPPESILLVSSRTAMGCGRERVHLYVTLDPDGLFSRDTPGSHASWRSLIGSRA